jgi:hypothetical protein
MEYVFDFNSYLSTDVYYTEKTSIKLNLFYLHASLLSSVLYRQRDTLQGGLFPKQAQFDRLTERLIKRDHVYIYSEQFDD